MKFLIVKCEELSGNVEKVPLCIVYNYAKYNIYGYEIYKIIYPDRKLKLVKDYKRDNVQLLHLI